MVDGDDPTANHEIHAPGQDGERMLGRRSPVGESESALASRDWQPRTGGPELVASWPLGHPPEGRGTDDWLLPAGETVLQRNVLPFPYAGAVDYAPGYVSATGRASVGAEATLSVTLDCEHLSGEQYGTTVELADVSDEPFVTPMVEFTPEVEAYEGMGRVFGEYALIARVDGEGVRLNQGTGVQLWSE